MMNEDEFYELFDPLEAPTGDGDLWTEEDLESQNVPEQHIWTVVETNNGFTQELVPGMHGHDPASLLGTAPMVHAEPVEAIGYIVTERAWTDPTERVELDDELVEA